MDNESTVETSIRREAGHPSLQTSFTPSISSDLDIIAYKNISDSKESEKVMDVQSRGDGEDVTEMTIKTEPTIYLNQDVSVIPTIKEETINSSITTKVNLETMETEIGENEEEKNEEREQIDDDEHEGENGNEIKHDDLTMTEIIKNNGVENSKQTRRYRRNQRVWSTNTKSGRNKKYAKV